MIFSYLEANFIFGIIFSYIFKTQIFLTMRKALFFLVLLISSTAIGQDKPMGTPKIGIKVPLGSQVDLQDISIKFVEVLEDSRCPKYTTCMWEGRAKIAVEISEEGQETTTKELIFGKTLSGENNEFTLHNNEGYSIEAMALTPYPGEEAEGSVLTYNLIICEVKEP